LKACLAAIAYDCFHIPLDGDVSRNVLALRC
jgi:hypothetical protein